MSRSLRFAAGGLLLVVLALGGGCRPAPEDGVGELETEEVAPPPDALVNPEDDPVERRTGGSEVAGVLPGDFPAGLPVPEGGSVTDLGGGPEGAWVEITVPRAAAAARTAYAARLRSAGWTASGEDRWSRDGRTVTITTAAAGPSARVRIAY